MKPHIRTPEQQAEKILKGNSWTCNSSHMSKAAMDLGLKLGGTYVSNFSQLTKDKDKGLAKQKKAAYDEFVKLFSANMQKQKLRNYKGGTGFLSDSSDPLHMELPNSRLKDTDPLVTKCLLYYAEATRKKGRAKNKAYEEKKGSAYQKQWLKDYDKKKPGPGATIRGVVYSYQPKLHDAVGAVVTLTNTKSNFRKVVTANLTLSELLGHKSCYVISGVPDAESGTYRISGTYKNPLTGRTEKSKVGTLLGPLKPGSTINSEVHMQS